MLSADLLTRHLVTHGPPRFVSTCGLALWVSKGMSVRGFHLQPCRLAYALACLIQPAPGEYLDPVFKDVCIPCEPDTYNVWPSASACSGW